MGNFNKLQVAIYKAEGVHYVLIKRKQSYMDN